MSEILNHVVSVGFAADAGVTRSLPECLCIKRVHTCAKPATARKHRRRWVRLGFRLPSVQLL